MQYGLCIDGTRHGVTHDTVEGKSLIPPPGRWRKTSGGGLPPSLSDDSFSGSSALSSTSSCPCSSPDFCPWPCALCSPSLLSHSCLRLPHLHPPFYQATTSQRLSEVSSQHQTQVSPAYWTKACRSASHTRHLPAVVGANPISTPIFPSGSGLHVSRPPPPRCPRGFLPCRHPAHSPLLLLPS